MATTLQFRRGNTSIASATTTAIGELFINTDTSQLSVGDGTTVGGILIARVSDLAIETFTSPSISANAVTLNLNTGSIFALASNASNITANFTNVPTTSGKIISTSMIITQNGTAYYPSAVTINGSGSLTIKWLGGASPTATANKTEAVNFTFICTATSTYTVIGSLVSYG